jgi:hypothetical protein
MDQIRGSWIRTLWSKEFETGLCLLPHQLHHMCQRRWAWDAGTAYIHGLQFVQGNFVLLMDADLSHHVRSQPTTWLQFQDMVLLQAT